MAGNPNLYNLDAMFINEGESTHEQSTMQVDMSQRTQGVMEGILTLNVNSQRGSELTLTDDHDQEIPELWDSQDESETEDISLDLDLDTLDPECKELGEQWVKVIPELSGYNLIVSLFKRLEFPLNKHKRLNLKEYLLQEHLKGSNNVTFKTYIDWVQTQGLYAYPVEIEKLTEEDNPMAIMAKSRNNVLDEEYFTS